ncbi:hypothetical protein BOTBODRAFT_28044 [Botryobasidium botryosum FD-172 SS1]|uniref:Yeast cell wall synthesis Kre9/Knh1-like N-terminal domain-containing protein n=1 Tax=Botryobasidium botryosum (strain FD-172 SS1) TaxID=930990 RepID=A0A067N6S3_BOTB1|nr:hypothetical protein BOTBODRAFT_28044 [Botryobasidium botryosum FD-172 SS1]
MFFAGLKLAVLAVLPLLVAADPNPNVPGPTDIYQVGGQCPIGWDLDKTGTWTAMTIQFMTGENFNMIPLATVATVDATKTSTYSWPCPNVSPCSQIYFYQFSSPTNATDLLWTTRFTIKCANGSTTPPANPTESDGSAVPWGNGSIISNTTTPAPPPAVSASSTAAVNGTTAVATATPVTPPPHATTPASGSGTPGPAPAPAAPGGTGTPSAAGATSPSGAPSANAASASGAQSIMWGIVAFGLAALAL